MADINDEKIRNRISELRRKYIGNDDAQDEIKRAVETIIYYEKRKENDKAKNHAEALEDFLHDWY